MYLTYHQKIDNDPDVVNVRPEVSMLAPRAVSGRTSIKKQFIARSPQWLVLHIAGRARSPHYREQRALIFIMSAVRLALGCDLFIGECSRYLSTVGR
ncbi:hypothetical protein K3495_g1604 [Podosphaera aphanis]|nr:hypothetical protein K3495_g1604 [Podosphaera aphanis]